MAPAVPIAEYVPTTAPVSCNEANLILTTIGGIADRTAAGREEPDQAEADDRNRPGRSRWANQVHQQWRGHCRQPAGDEERADEATGVSPIGRSTAGPRSHRDPGEDDTDDAREHLEADPQVGRKQSPGQDLEDEDRGGCDEDERPGEELWQPPEYARRHEYAAYDAANAEVVSGRGVVAARSVHHRRRDTGPQNRRQTTTAGPTTTTERPAPVNSWRISTPASAPTRCSPV